VALNALIAPIQEKYQASKEWQEVALKAYPPVEKPKFVKKVKNRGTGYPGAARNDTTLPIRTNN
jgi:tyrosyl-tRNA synthetase